MPDEIPMSGRPRVTEPAERWAIEGFDPEDPSDSTLVLFAEDGTALTMPFDPDLLAACTTVAQAWYGDIDVEEDGDDYLSDQYEDDDEDDEDGPLGGMSRLTGWHQVSAFWDNLSEERRNKAMVGAVIVILLLITFTQFVL